MCPNPHLLSTSYMEIPVRAINAFRNHHITTVDDVLREGDDLMKLPKFGRKTLNEVKESVARQWPALYTAEWWGYGNRL